MFKWLRKKPEEVAKQPPFIPDWSNPATTISFKDLDDSTIQILTSVLGQLTMRGENKQASLEIVNICLGLSLEAHKRNLLTLGVESCEYEPPVDSYKPSKSLKVVRKESKK